MKSNRERTETTLIHGGSAINETNAVVPPIWQTSTYKAPDDPEAFSALAASTNPSEFYSRHGNPTNKQIEEILATLEGTESAMLTSSGMGAISTVVLSQVKAGEHVVAQSSLYAATMVLLRDVLPKWNIEVSFVNQTDNAAFEAAIRPNTKLIYVETPSNPMMRLTDLAFIGKLGHARNIITVCDNTFATPLNQRPHDFGIDAIVHSATKYLGGHSDLTAGAICASKSIVEDCWKMMIVLGAPLASFDAWLLLRGLRTLSLRVKTHNENAYRLALFLESHPKIERVHFPLLQSHPQHGLAKAQMHGCSGMMSVEVKGETEEERFERAQHLIKRLKLAVNAVSLGGVETLVVHPASMWRYHYTDEQRRAAGIDTGLVRLSVGIEHSDDLISDFEQALSEA
ncbi:MAG: aminotransferase class I/II-fold pyridoxal phosphate-dependent enzyme [Chloroherpetonaceae bacterium]